jgi:hypothetical protein
MGKSFFDSTEEERGSLPKLTGALLKIKSFERTKTGDNAKTPGCRMYVMQASVVEPKKYANTTLRKYFVIGTESDPLGKEEETWNRSEAGPGQLKRTLVRSGTPLSKEDEEWMEAAEGREFVAPIGARVDDSGYVRNDIGKAYRSEDEDCPVIGEAGDEPKGKRGKPAKKAKPEPEAEETEESEEPKKASKPPKSKPAKPADDDDDDDEED